jgi:predicted negative regulator of RcsB-dependent stress response
VEDYLSEKEKWEWLRAQIRDNAPTVLAAVALTAAAIFGWKWWQARQDTERMAASAMYSQIIQALDRNDRTQAYSLMGQLERDHASSPYADQTRLLAARLDVEANQLDKAAAELTAVMQGSKDRDLSLVARERLARVQIAQHKTAEALATLDGADPGAFAARFHETRGDAYYAGGDRAAALTEYHAAQKANAGAEAALLDLKVADLAANAPPAVAAGAAAAPPAPAAPVPATLTPAAAAPPVAGSTGPATK